MFFKKIICLKIEENVETAFEITLCYVSNVSTTNIIQNHVKNNNKKCNFFLNYVFPIKQSFLNDFFF